MTRGADFIQDATLGHGPYAQPAIDGWLNKPARHCPRVSTQGASDGTTAALSDGPFNKFSEAASGAGAPA